MKKRYFFVALVLFLMIFVFRAYKNNTKPEKTTEMITELTAVVTTEETTEKKEQKTTEKVTKEKSTSTKGEKTTETQVNAPVVETTNNVVPATQASKPVVTTKPVETTKKPTTTKPAPKPTTTKAQKDEYYPALTAADMKTLEAYCKQYVESKGYTYDSSLNWDNCGYGCTSGLSDDLSMYGNKYKISGGISPLERFKMYVREGVDSNIESFGDRKWLSMVFLYQRVGNGWEIAVGYMA